VRQATLAAALNGLYGIEMWPNGDAVTNPLTGHYLQSAQFLATGQICPQ
jgi:hypothetical protein